MSDDLVLTTRFELKTYSLLLAYEVVNDTKRDAYLLNRLYTPTPRWNFDPNLIYVYLQAEKSTVWLAKKIATIPAGRGVLSPVAPFVTPLRAGAKFTEEVNIPVPIREYREYSPPPSPAPAQPRQLVFNQVYFTLDYYWAAKGMREETRKIGNQTLVLPWVPPGVHLKFGQLSGPVQRMNLKALVA